MPLSASVARVVQRKAFKAARRQPIDKWTIVRGDKVQILSGQDAGKQGIVKEVLRHQNSVIVDGLNLRTRVVRATQSSSGFVHKVPAKIHRSNVNLVDPVENKPCKVALVRSETGEKMRVSKLTKAVIPTPETLKTESVVKRVLNTLTDTSASEVRAQTYVEPNFSSIHQYIQQRITSAPRHGRWDPSSIRGKIYQSKPRLPPFPYVQAKKLVGKQAELHSKLVNSGLPEGIQYTIKH